MPSANARWYKVGDALVVLSQGDIAQWSGDALVNAGQRGDLVLAFPCDDRRDSPQVTPPQQQDPSAGRVWSTPWTSLTVVAVDAVVLCLRSK